MFVLIFIMFGLTLGYARLNGYSGEIFQAIAHLYMGLLLGAALWLRQSKYDIYMYWFLFVSLVAVELYAFFMK